MKDFPNEALQQFRKQSIDCLLEEFLKSAGSISDEISRRFGERVSGWNSEGLPRVFFNENSGRMSEGILRKVPKKFVDEFLQESLEEFLEKYFEKIIEEAIKHPLEKPLQKFLDDLLVECLIKFLMISQKEFQEKS